MNNLNSLKYTLQEFSPIQATYTQTISVSIYYFEKIGLLKCWHPYYKTQMVPLLIRLQALFACILFARIDTRHHRYQTCP
jgi:hypothetical protein